MRRGQGAASPEIPGRYQKVANRVGGWLREKVLTGRETESMYNSSRPLNIINGMQSKEQD